MTERNLLKLPFIALTGVPPQEMANFLRNLERFIINVTIDQVRLSTEQLPMNVTGNVGSVQNILPLTAEDLGASAGSQINIAAHTCTHAPGLIVSYGAGTLTVDDQGVALPYSADIVGGDVETFYVYVDNEDYSDLTAPNYKATDDPTVLLSDEDEGRYRVGTIIMPEDGGAATDGGGGGGGGVTFAGGTGGNILP